MTKNYSDHVNEMCHYATPSELDWLRDWAKSVYSVLGTDDYPRAVMIGAGPGVMAIALLEGNKLIDLTVIDKNTCEYVKAHIGQCIDLSNPSVTYIIDDSANYGERWTENIDLLIVDGDHSYEGVKRDLEAWLSHMNKGGIVFLHDYDATDTEFADMERYPGVKQAVDECQFKWREVRKVGTAIVMRIG